MNREAEELAHGVGRGDLDAISRRSSAGWVKLTDILRNTLL